MDSRKIVFHETGIVIIGQVLCTSIMIGVFKLLGMYDTSVLLGSIIGAVLAIGNFFFMAIGTSLAADKAESQDIKGGQLLIHNSYMLRLVTLFIILFICAKSGMFNLLSLVLPLVFVRPTITTAEILRKSGEKKL